METRLIKIHPDNPDRSTLKAVSRMLTRGEICVLPTDTIYGFHCRIDDENALGAVQSLKDRPAGKPMVILIPGPEHLARWQMALPSDAQVLTGRFWPGPLTVVLPAPAGLPAILTAGSGTMAVRHPGYPILNKLLEFTGVPLISTSVNHAGQDPLLEADRIMVEFGGRFHCLLDAGMLPIRKPSTIVSFATEPPRILRPGAIPADFIRRLAPSVSI